MEQVLPDPVAGIAARIRRNTAAGQSQKNLRPFQKTPVRTCLTATRVCEHAGDPCASIPATVL